MATVLDLITDALQEIGVYGAAETVSAEDAAVCLTALNGLLDSWTIENLNLYAQTDVVAALPAATVSRTIGPSMQFNCDRPVRLELGCFVRVGELDYPLDVIDQVQYNEITLKTQSGGWPTCVTYDTEFPTGNVYFWPTGACEVHLNVATQIDQFTATTDTFTLPPGYRRALTLTLAEEVAPKFQVQVQAQTARKAMNARRNLKRANLVVPQLQIGGDDTLPGRYAILGG
jgi:hypothetical protein